MRKFRPAIVLLLILVAALAAGVLLAAGPLPGSGPAPIEAQGTGQGERIDARLLPDPDDGESPSPGQLAALDEISRSVGGRPQAGFNPLNGTPRVLFVPGSFLSGPTASPPRTVARNFLLDHADLFAISPQFVSGLVESRVFKNENSGITHVQYEQQYEGLNVFQSTLRIHVTAEGRVLMVMADYYPELSLPSTDPVLSRQAAMDAAFAEVGPPRDLPPLESDTDPMTASMRDLYTPTAERVVFPLPGKSATLAWQVVVPQSIDMWEVVVDADSGAVLYVANRTVDNEEGQVFVEHPDAGAQVTVPFTGSLPAPRDAWVGANSFTTCTTCSAGNNGLAIEDRDDDGTGDFAYDPAGHLNFGFDDSYADTGNPTDDQDTSITNLFYLTNVAHDHFYELGFDEAAGNFQDDNFGAGGTGGDPVFATTYTGWDSCTFRPSLPGFDCRNNAWFSTSPDGTAGVMQTFLFTAPQLARRDPSLDGDVILHEYGHGVSTRLVGVGGLSGIQSGAMGEGWSDYFPVSFYDDPVAGEYSTQNPTTGIRRYAYDNSPLTYGDLCTSPFGCEVHDDGEIWGAAMWDLRAFYVSQLGVVAGSQAADELVIEGLMLTPASPSMLDGRDAILQAELAMGGANQCAVWQVFADRGMGDSATSAGDTATVTEAFDVPSFCMLAATDLKIYQVDDAPTDVNVSETEPFTVTKTVHNNGPDTPVNARIVSSGDAPVGCDLSYTSIDNEQVDIPAGVPYTYNGTPGVGPASIPTVATDHTVVSGTPAVTNEIVVTVPAATVGSLDVSVSTPIVEHWDKHCFEPSEHEFVITNEIERTDPFAPPDPVPANNISVSTIVENVWAEADVNVTDVSIAGIDTDGNTTVDIPGLPSATIPAITSDDGYDNDGDGLVDEDPIGDCDSDDSPDQVLDYTPGGSDDDDSDGLTDEDGGHCLQLVIDKTLHNYGPYGPVDVAISGAGTGIVPTGLPGPAGLVPANCTLTPLPGNPSSASLPVSVPTVVTEKYTLHCGLSPFQNLNDDLGPPSFILNGGEADEDLIGGPGGDDDGDTLIDEDACDGVDNDADTLVDEDDPLGNADCDFYDPTLGEDSLFGNGIPEALLDGVDDDGDTFIDEGAPGSCGDTLDNGSDLLTDSADGQDCQTQTPTAFPLVDDDPSFEVAAFQFVEEISLIDPHLMDPNVTDNTNNTSDALPAFLPSNPSFTMTIDDTAAPSDIGHTFPGLIGTPPVAGDCLVGQACEMLSYQDQPGGNPLHAVRTNVPNPDGVPGGQGFDIASGLQDLDTGAPVPNGTLMAHITYAINLDVGWGCNFPINSALSLTDGALPGPGSAFFPNGGLLVEGPDDPTAPALSDPTVWPTRLESDLQLAYLVHLGGIVWARYTGLDAMLGVPVNIVVVNLGPFGFEHVFITEDPSTPSAHISCTPFITETDYLGETAPGLADLRVCNEVATHIFTTAFTRADSGVTTTTADTGRCSNDADGDGIEGSIDGTWSGAVFTDESLVFSDNFTDQHLGGTTFGEILDRGGLTVEVTELANPEGVNAAASGPAGSATIEVCTAPATQLTLTSGNSVAVKCSSATLEVLSGPITATFGTIEASVPTGTTLTVTETSPGVFDVENVAGSTGSITVGGLTLAPGESATGVTDTDGDGVVDSVDTCPGAPDPSWPVPGGDGDCDGFSDADEGTIGTDPADNCPDDPADDAWPSDFDKNTIINLGDVFNVLPPHFGTSVPPTSPRRDLVPDGFINLADVFKVLPPYFGTSCTP